MNNSENNNQENNEGLNAISLGNVSIDNGNNIPTIDPVPPVAPIPTNNDSNQVVSESVQINNVTESTPVTSVPLEPETQNLESAPEVNEVPGVIEESVGGEQNVGNGTQSVSTESVVNAIPTTDVLPVAPLNYDVPETINNFDPTPVFNNIGTVPPIPDIPVVDSTMQAPKDDKKKGMPKILFILIVILALAAVGVGVYIFLHKSNIMGPSVVTKNVRVEVGSKLSTNINDYATFGSIDSSTCSLDVASIPATLETLNAEYTFRITCNQASFSGKLTVVDTIPPEVTLKEKVEVALNSSVKPEDFIEECKDSTKCSYSFKDAEKVSGNLKEASNYHVDIIIKDEAGNQTEKTGTLIVSDVPVFEEADMYLSCSKAKDNGMTDNTKFGVVDGEYKRNAVLKRYTFELELAELETLKTANEGKAEMTYKDITGQPTFGENLVLSRPVSYDTIKAEVGEDLPTSVGDLRTILTEKGYVCSYEYE